MMVCDRQEATLRPDWADLKMRSTGSQRRGGISSYDSVQAEVGEIEARRHNAADQYRRLASRRSALPNAAGNDGLRSLARAEIVAKHDSNSGGRLATGAAHAQVQRAATVPEPQLVGADHMPARPLARMEQKVDGGRGAARPAVPLGREGHR